MATILPSRMPISRSVMPAVVRIRRPRMTRSYGATRSTCAPAEAASEAGLVCRSSAIWARTRSGRLTSAILDGSVLAEGDTGAPRSGSGGFGQVAGDLGAQAAHQGTGFGHAAAHVGLDVGQRPDPVETGATALRVVEGGASTDGEHGR